MSFLAYFVASFVGHFVGDYLLQNQWMAIGKSAPGKKGHIACTAHVLAYTFAIFLFTGWHPLFLLAVFVPHWVIDRWSLANYVLAAKNGYHPYDTWKASPDGDPLIDQKTLIHNVWKVSFGAYVYALNDNTLHFVCLWLACKWFFRS